MILRSEWGFVLIPILASMFKHFNTGTWSVLNRILTPWLENAKKQKHEIMFPLCDTTSLLGIRSSRDGLFDLGTGHTWVHFLVTSCKAYPFPCENYKLEKLLVLPFQATILLQTVLSRNPKFDGRNLSPLSDINKTHLLHCDSLLLLNWFFFK